MGRFCAISDSIVRRLTLAALMLMALVASAVRLPATNCTATRAPIGKSCPHGCCANMGCCADSQKNNDLSTVPLTKVGRANQELVAIFTLGLTTRVFAIQSFDPSPEPLATQVTGSVSKFALLCTFLI